MRSALILALLHGLAAAQDVTDADIETDADRASGTEIDGTCFLRGARILTAASEEPLEHGSILIRDGKIVAVGRDLDPPPGVRVIELEGRTIIPGIVDAHSHIALEAVNESSRSITADVRIRDVIDPSSVSIFRAAAGGCTAANLLHGSANAIGGQCAVIKTKYRASIEELLFPGAPAGIKFALGENPKQSNWKDSGNRFPNTRMGVEAVFRRAFREAQDYLREWEDYRRRQEAGEGVTEPRRDIRLEALAGVLKGEIRVHCHSYRADEILMILRVAEEFGFRIAALQHVLEGYKVAPEIARAGAGASTFADWWAYKFEVYDAIPHNAALMTRAGIVVSINSDSDDFIRRLNQEAAKSMKYGGLPEHEALRLVTLNPARQLGLAQRIGSIEAGKDADLAVFNGHPFSPYSRCVMTLIDGRVVFEEPGAVDHSTADFDPRRRPRRDPPPPPGAGRPATAIVGATIVTVSSEPIANGTVLIRDGTIAAVGEKISLPPDVEVIRAEGLFVYPGLIDAASKIGLIEIDSVRGTRDDSEIGDIHPDLLASTAVHADSELIPVARANGITTVLAAPDGGLICGRASFLQLDGWTPEEMTLIGSCALVVNFPRHPDPPPPDRKPTAKETEERKKNDEEADKRKKDLRKWFEDARRYAGALREARNRKEAGPPFDPRLDALAPYAEGNGLVIIRADTARQIREAIELALPLGLRVALAGADDAWKVRSLLKEKDVPLLLHSPYDLPRDDFDRYDSVFRNAARLHDAGVRFAIVSQDAADTRNLPYHAATAAAFGLPRDEALKCVTLRPAEILGLADRTGSIEAGKRADLIVTTGDPLEILTDVVYEFIGGRPVSLENRHTRLYARYRQRLEGAADKRR